MKPPPFKGVAMEEKEMAVAYIGQNVEAVTVMKDQQSTLRVKNATVLLE